VDRVCHVVSVTNPYGSILGFLDRSRYYFFQVAPQYYLRGWVDPVPDLLLFFLIAPGNRTRDLRICSQELWPLDHRGGQAEIYIHVYSHVNFECIYFRLKTVVRPKHSADNLNKIVNNYWNRVALDGNPWTWPKPRNRMQTLKFRNGLFQRSNLGHLNKETETM
jgi:hypothetical protein